MAQVINFGKVTVLNPYGSGDTSIVLQAGMGARLPTPPFNLVWWNFTDYADPSDDPNREIVRCTNLVTDTLTVVRGQEGIGASTKNTAGKTYKMIAGFTAKGPETLGAGAGASPPVYVADFRSGAGQAQLHLTEHDADDGAWVLGFHGAGLYLMQGAYFDGTNFIAKEINATVYQLPFANTSALIINKNNGLTVGNTFTPTEVARVSATGALGLLGIGAPNVSVDTSGAMATRFLSVTLANGLNSNIAIATSGNIRASGPTGAYSLGGFSGGFDGRELYFYNNLAQTVTIVNGDASSTAANRIQTNTGGNVVLRATATSNAVFKYDSSISLWVLVSSN